MKDFAFLNLHFIWKIKYVIVKHYHPHGSLSQIVTEYTLVAAFRTDGLSDIVAPFPPVPQQSLYFYLNDPLKVIDEDNTNQVIIKPKALFVGTQISTKHLALSSNHLMFYINFYPGALHRLLKVSLSEFTDTDIDASFVLGESVHFLLEKLKFSTSYEEIPKLVDQFLIKQFNLLKPALPIDHAIHYLLKEDGNITMDTLASMAFVSVRQMERQFKERIGVPPKMYAKLIRFSKAYRMKEINPFLTWTRIAHSCGYYDQMHLIRDFKTFTKMNPGSLEELILITPYHLQSHLG